MNITDFKDIIYIKQSNGLVELTINQVKRKNAMSPLTFLELWWAMEHFDNDNSAKVLIISGSENPKETDITKHAFSSGGYFNPAELNHLPPELSEQVDLSDIAQTKLTLRMAKVTKPVIAAINGFAIGAGFTMLLSGADLIYMASSAYIKMPFVSIAIVPEFASTYIMPRLLGMQKAKEIFFFGKAIQPNEALAMGLINAVYPHDELMDKVREHALSLTPPKGASVAIMETKKAFNQPLIEYYEKALLLENEGLLKSAGTKDFIEGMVSRKEKRDTNYLGE